MQTVKVSSRNQIAVPKMARDALDIHPGDRLIVEVWDNMLLLIPKPTSYTDYLAGLHGEIWQDIDTTQYLHEERAAWRTDVTVDD